MKVSVEDRYGAGEALPDGAIKLASAQFAKHELIIYNSPPIHDFKFTPSMSLYVECDSADALDAAWRPSTRTRAP